MSEEQVVDVENTVENETPEAPANPGASLDQLSSGYIVGVTPEGQVVFDVVGSRKNLVEVLGLHEYAAKRVKALSDQALTSGDTLVHEVGKAISIVNMKVDQLKASKS